MLNTTLHTDPFTQVFQTLIKWKQFVEKVEWMVCHFIFPRKDKLITEQSLAKKKGRRKPEPVPFLHPARATRWKQQPALNWHWAVPWGLDGAHSLASDHHCEVGKIINQTKKLLTSVILQPAVKAGHQLYWHAVVQSLGWIPVLPSHLKHVPG